MFISSAIFQVSAVLTKLSKSKKSDKLVKMRNLFNINLCYNIIFPDIIKMAAGSPMLPSGK
jgi:hypothetical protein